MLTPDIKELIAIAAGVLIIGNHINYLRAIVAGRAQPHFYSWLIWTITQGTAATAVIVGGGGATGIALFASASLVCGVALTSLRYGTKDITRRDGVMLITALLAILFWWLFDNPLVAVILDLVTYVLLVLALAEYSLLTTTYLATMCVMSVCTVSLLYYRRFIR
jgi:hypothetical protein